MNDSSEAYSRTWRPVPAPPGDGKFTRRFRVAVLAAAALAVSGALIAWLLYLRPFPRAYFLPLCIDEYGGEFPIRPWVRQDGEALRGLGWEEQNAFTIQERELLVQELRTFARRQGDGPLVVYLNGLARATPEGELCVLPVDARLDRPATWLPLRDVFKYLADSKARHKLLLLDIMQPFTDARRGLLLNDAARRLQPLLDEVLPKDPHLSVLCACSPGQTSVVAEELGHSVFAHFLRDGLRGQADRENPRQNSDGRVSMKELAAYVTAQVDRWTWRHRRVRQTPRLQGADEDYPLVAARPDAAPPEESPLEADYPEWLTDGWKLRDRWLDEEAYRLDPETVRGLEDALLRAEQQWRGGVRVERVRQELKARRERLERQWGERPAGGAAPPDSLAAATAGGRNLPKLADAESVAAVARLAARHARAAAGKPDPKELEKLKSGADQLRKKFDGQPLALAWVVFAAADADDPTPAALGFLSGLLKQERVPQYAETRLLARLAELPVTAPDDWPAKGVRLALRTVREAETAAAGDPRTLPWMREVRAGAARLRREGEALLFAPAPADRRRAADVLLDALRAYQAINRDQDAVAEALRCRDEARAQLAGYVAYLEVDDATETAWRNAVATARKLCQESAAPVAAPGPRRDAQIRALTEWAAALRNDPDNLHSLRRPLDREHFERLIGRRRAGDAADGKVMTALLETPWPRADQRAKLWSARHELLGVFWKGRVEASVPAWDEGRAIEAERQRGLRRARCALALLQLERSDPGEEVGKALARAEEAPADAGRMQALAESLRQAWMRRAERSPAEER